MSHCKFAHEGQIAVDRLETKGNEGKTKGTPRRRRLQQNEEEEVLHAVITQLRCKLTAGTKGCSGETRTKRPSEPHFERLGKKRTLSVPS